MNDPNNNRQLHFKRIEENDLVLRQLPRRIQPDKVRSPLVVEPRVQRQLVRLQRLLFIEIDEPTTPEDIHGLGENIIVDKTRVHREEPHEKNNVSPGEENAEDFAGDLLPLDLLLGEYQVPSKARHDNRVTKISEHHGKQEWESDNGVQSRVSFTVRRHTVGIDQVLETLGEPVGPVERWRHLVGVDDVQERRDRATRSRLDATKLQELRR